MTQADLAAVRKAGYANAQIIEIIALSAHFLPTNFANNAVDTGIDFPTVERQMALITPDAPTRRRSSPRQI